MYRVSQATQIAPKLRKLWAIAHENAIKRENDEFLVITLKHVSGLTSHANRLGTPKLWAIALENGHKRENYEVLVLTLKHVSGLSSHANRPETPKTVGNSS